MNKNLMQKLRNDKLINKYLARGCWLSGSSTIVYPFTIYRNKDGSINDITIQLNTSKNVFNKLIARYKQEFEYIEYMYFWKSDGSCPSMLTIKCKEGCCEYTA